MDKKDFLAKLNKYDVGEEFHKKSMKMIEQLFDKKIEDKSRKQGMDFVLKIYKSQADFKKNTDKIKESLKELKKTKATKSAPAKKKGFFGR